MKLQEIFNQLIYGELSQLYMGQGEGNNVDAFGNPQIGQQESIRITSMIEMGMTALHKRFRLKEERFKLELQDFQESYLLDSRFAESNDQSEAESKYIKDAEWPFKDNILKIERVYDNLGNERVLNRIGDPDALRTVSENILVVPKYMVDPDNKDTPDFKYLTVVYRADHPKIDRISAQHTAFDTDIDFPSTHLEPLLYYVASRVMNPVGASGEFHEGNNYAQKYEQACRMLEQQNYQRDPEGEMDRFEGNGWV